MPLWDFYCAHCNTTIELSFSIHQNTKHARCLDCGTPLEKQIGKSNFIITGYSAKNGYTKG